MTLDRLAEKDKIEKVAPGFYTLKDAFVDDCISLRVSIPEGFFLMRLRSIFFK
ncbi:hypothetical protein [Enterococcus faecium]|uniref:hypothetical protein n=1 Tax=Enterococcus faecium TaxID=1352 RepID=UPI0038B675A1